MSRNRDDPFAICHDNVFPLACNPKTTFFKCLYGFKVVYASEFGHLRRYLDLSNIRVLQVYVEDLQVLLDRTFDIV